jgi:hypothetical protein
MQLDSTYKHKESTSLAEDRTALCFLETTFRIQDKPKYVLLTKKMIIQIKSSLTSVHLHVNMNLREIYQKTDTE